MTKCSMCLSIMPESELSCHVYNGVEVVLCCICASGIRKCSRCGMELLFADSVSMTRAIYCEDCYWGEIEDKRREIQEWSDSFKSVSRYIPEKTVLEDGVMITWARESARVRNIGAR